MRVLPHAFADDSWSSLRREVLANGAATHGHPRALVGALLYAVAARCALKKTSGWSLGELIERVLSDRAVWAEPPSRDETLPDWYDAAIEATQGTFSIDWASAVSESDQALHFALQAIRQGIVSSDEDVLDSIKARNSKINGAGTVSAVAAVFLASRYAADPATGIRVAAYAQGVDTDTVASMTGGILGTMIGSDWLLGAWREVQDASLFGRLATDLGSSRHQARGISQGWHQGDLWSDGDSRRLRNALVNCQLGERIHVGPLGEANLEGVDVLDPMVRSSRMTRFRLITADGQRLFVLKPERLRESSQAVLPLSPVSEEASAQSMSHRTQRAGAEHVHAPFRSARSDLAVVVSALPAGTSAIDLHQLLDMAAAAMEVIRSTRSLQHPGLQDDISRSLQSVLAELSIHLPPEAVPALGRTAWRLAAGAERSTPKSARSDGDALSSD
jgi:hypothetical protein